MKQSELYREVLESNSEPSQESFELGEYDLDDIGDLYDDFKHAVDRLEGEDDFETNLDYTDGKEELYEVTESLLENRDYQSEELAQFASENLEGQYDGIFLSAAINQMNDERIELPALNDLELIGWKNTKEVAIYGDVKAEIGKEMQGGKIEVVGDAEEKVGESMTGGEITINGQNHEKAGWKMQGGSIEIENGTANNTAYVGDGMKDGEIIVKSDAKAQVGHGMSGGKITVEGDTEFWIAQSMTGGEITVERNANDWIGKGMEGGNVYIEGDLGEDALQTPGFTYDEDARMTGGKIHQKQNGEWQVVKES